MLYLDLVGFAQLRWPVVDEASFMVVTTGF